MQLNLYFHSQLGPVCLKGVKAYVLKDMEANLIISKDTQKAWQLHIMRKGDKSYWKVGDSPHNIPGMSGPAPIKTFAIQWIPEKSSTESIPPVIRKLSTKSTRKQWNGVAKHDLTLLPESIATVTAVSRGLTPGKSIYLEAIPLKRGSDSFISAPHGIVNLDSDCCFKIKITNMMKCRIHLHSGELLGHLFRTESALRTAKELSIPELLRFTNRVTQLATLILSLDAMSETSSDKPATAENEEAQPHNMEHLGWGPKMMDPGLDQIYPSEKLREVIDVDPALEPDQ
jgi:hypothetical protein